MKFVQKIGYKSSAGIRAKLSNITYEPFHMHDDSIEIICILDGTVYISDAAATYTLQYGDVHIFNLTDPHRIYSDKNNIVLTVHIDFAQYRKNHPSLEDKPYFISDTRKKSLLKNEDLRYYSNDIMLLRFYLATAYKSYCSEEPDYSLEECGRRLFDYLVNSFQGYTYIESVNRVAYIVHAQKETPADKDRDRMLRVVDYIYDHYSEKISLVQVAKMEYVTPSHLSRYIHETLGLTFSQQVSLARCESSAKLLGTTHKSVDQIAEETGFANRKHLALQFKKWYGKTPSHYRSEILHDLNSENTLRLRSFDYSKAMSIIEMYLDEY